MTPGCVPLHLGLDGPSAFAVYAQGRDALDPVTRDARPGGTRGRPPGLLAGPVEVELASGRTAGFGSAAAGRKVLEHLAEHFAETRFALRIAQSDFYVGAHESDPHAAATVGFVHLE